MRIRSIDAEYQALSQSNRAHIEKFCEYLHTWGRRKLTQRTYRYHLIKLLLFLDGKELSVVSHDDLNSYFTYQRNKKNFISTQSLRVLISCYNAFFVDYLGKPELRFEQRKAKQPENKFKLELSSKIYSIEEMSRLLVACSSLKRRSHMFRALLSIAYDAALRIFEVMNLKRADIDFKERKVFVREGKGGKSGFVMGLSQQTLRVVKEYWESSEYVKNADDWAFPVKISKGKRNTKVVPVYEMLVDRLLRKCEDAAGIAVGVRTFHSLRHSNASHLLDIGYTIAEIKEKLRHAERSNVVMMYLHNTHSTKKKNPIDDVMK